MAVRKKFGSIWARVVTTVGLAGLVAVGLTSPAYADPGNVGKYTEDKLYPGQYLRNGEYTFWMQTDGNLVLYHDPGRVCWASNTAGLEGTYLDYDDSFWDGARLRLINTRYGLDRRWYGRYSAWGTDGNLSLNSGGQVWIAYKYWVHC